MTNKSLFYNKLLRVVLLVFVLSLNYLNFLHIKEIEVFVGIQIAYYSNGTTSVYLRLIIGGSSPVNFTPIQKCKRLDTRSSKACK